MNLFDSIINNGHVSIDLPDGGGHALAIVDTACTIAPRHPVSQTLGVVSRPSGADAWSGASFTATVRGTFSLSITVGGVARNFSLVVCHADLLEIGPIKYHTHSNGAANTDRPRATADKFRVLANFIREHHTAADLANLTSATPKTALAGVIWSRYGA